MMMGSSKMNLDQTFRYTLQTPTQELRLHTPPPTLHTDWLDLDFKQDVSAKKYQSTLTAACPRSGHTFGKRHLWVP